MTLIKNAFQKLVTKCHVTAGPINKEFCWSAKNKQKSGYSIYYGQPGIQIKMKYLLRKNVRGIPAMHVLWMRGVCKYILFLSC